MPSFVACLTCSLAHSVLVLCVRVVAMASSGSMPSSIVAAHSQSEEASQSEYGPRRTKSLSPRSCTALSLPPLVGPVRPREPPAPMPQAALQSPAGDLEGDIVRAAGAPLVLAPLDLTFGHAQRVAQGGGGGEAAQPLETNPPPIDDGISRLTDDVAGIWGEDDAHAYDDEAASFVRQVMTTEARQRGACQQPPAPQPAIENAPAHVVVESSSLPVDFEAMRKVVLDLRSQIDTMTSRIAALEESEDSYRQQNEELRRRLAEAHLSQQVMETECAEVLQKAMEQKCELVQQLSELQDSHERQLQGMRMEIASRDRTHTISQTAIVKLGRELRAVEKERDDADQHSVQLSAQIASLKAQLVEQSASGPSMPAASHTDVRMRPAIPELPPEVAPYTPGSMVARLCQKFEPQPPVAHQRTHTSGHCVPAALTPRYAVSTKVEGSGPEMPSTACHASVGPASIVCGGGGPGVPSTACHVSAGQTALTACGGGGPGVPTTACHVSAGQSSAACGGGGPGSSAQACHVRAGPTLPIGSVGNAPMHLLAQHPHVSFDPMQRDVFGTPADASHDPLSHGLSQLRNRLPAQFHSEIDALQNAAKNNPTASTHANFEAQGLTKPSSQGQGFSMPSSTGNAPYPVPTFGQHVSEASHSARICRESETIQIPMLPTNVLDMGQWAMEVGNCVQAASGRTEIAHLRAWLNECRSEVANPNVAFATGSSPPEFVSLESKLNVALRNVLKSYPDQTLHRKIVREDEMLYDRGQVGWGGRRVLHEVLRFYQMSGDRLQQHAMQALWSLKWMGDDFEHMCEFENVMVRATDAASRCGMNDASITAKLADIVRVSPRVNPLFCAYEAAHRRNNTMHWRDIMDIVSQVVGDMRRERIDGGIYGNEGPPRVRPPRNPKNPPAGPAVSLSPAHQEILAKYPRVCRNSLGRKCTNPRCRYSHEAVPAADAALLKAAHDAKRAAAGNAQPNPGSPASATSGSSGIREIGLCEHFQKGTACPRMPNCAWRHGDSKEELVRVQQLRAQGGFGPRAKARATKPAAQPSIASVSAGAPMSLLWRA